MTAVEWLRQELLKRDMDNSIKDLFEQAKEMEKEALAIIRKFVNEFDEQGEMSWNTRDEAANFLNNL